jgi:hypothetical protein
VARAPTGSKGQLRVLLGSPPAVCTKDPRTRGPPGGRAGSPQTRLFFCESPLGTTWSGLVGGRAHQKEGPANCAC